MAVPEEFFEARLKAILDIVEVQNRRIEGLGHPQNHLVHEHLNYHDTLEKMIFRVVVPIICALFLLIFVLWSYSSDRFDKRLDRIEQHIVGEGM